MLHFAQQNEWQSTCSDHCSNGSQTSFNTCNTVHRLATPKLPSDGSRGSAASSRLRVRNENVVLGRNASQVSLTSAASPLSASSRCRSYKQASHKSSWGNGIPMPPRVPSNLGMLLDAGPLEDVDLNAGSDGDSLHSSQSPEADHEHISGVGYQSGTRKENSAPASKISNNTSQETAPARPFTVASEHPWKTDYTFQRWMSNLFRDGPSRKRSLKVRTERWTLDDFEEDKTTKPDLAERRKKYGHKKASSWSSFGFAGATKVDTASPDLSDVGESGVRSSRPIKSRFSKRSSRLSNGTGKSSIDGSRPDVQGIERSAWDRAVHRRKILEELIASEESHVADLKVLLHVSHP